MMKHFTSSTLAMLIACSLSGCAAIYESEKSCELDVNNISSFMFLECIGPNYEDETIEFDVINHQISGTNFSARFIESASTITNSNEYPGIGHLCHLLCLNNKDEPVFIASIINYKCIVSLNKCTKKANKFVIQLSDEKNSCFYAYNFTELVYEYMKENMKNRISQLEKEYSQNGLVLENLLFKGVGAKYSSHDK